MQHLFLGKLVLYAVFISLSFHTSINTPPSYPGYRSTSELYILASVNILSSVIAASAQFSEDCHSLLSEFFAIEMAYVAADTFLQKRKRNLTSEVLIHHFATIIVLYISPLTDVECKTFSALSLTISLSTVLIAVSKIFRRMRPDIFRVKFVDLLTALVFLALRCVCSLKSSCDIIRVLLRDGIEKAPAFTQLYINAIFVLNCLNFYYLYRIVVGRKKF
jgi:hypothetical protein